MHMVECIWKPSCLDSSPTLWNFNVGKIPHKTYCRAHVHGHAKNALGGGGRVIFINVYVNHVCISNVCGGDGGGEDIHGFKGVKVGGNCITNAEIEVDMKILPALIPLLKRPDSNAE